MTKEQILQKHFTAEFGHDGHGKFMQYILDAMEEYAQQQVKNLNIPAVMGSYNDGIFYGIRQCNSEFQVMFQQIYKEFTDLKRIRKKDVEIILSRYANIELGEDINPFLEEVSE